MCPVGGRGWREDSGNGRGQSAWQGVVRVQVQSVSVSADVLGFKSRARSHRDCPGMPKRPLRPCTNPACIVLHDQGGRCAACSTKRTKQQDHDRGSATARGYGGRWQRYRARFLAEHPLCVACEAKGFVEASTVLDHIIEVTGPSDPLFWEPTNHQALCRRCHEVKHGRMRA